MSRSIGLLTSIASTLDAFFPDWIELWQADGASVHTAAHGSPKLAHPDSHRHLRALSQRPNVRTAAAPLELKRWAERTQIECLLTNTATASAVSRLANLRIPVVYFCHGLVDPEERPRIVSKTYRMTERLLCRRTDAVIVMNASDANWFAANFPGPLLRLRAGVGLNCADWASTRRAYGQLAHINALNRDDTREYRVIWMGSLTDRKRPLDAIRIASHISKAEPRFRLLMAGEGPLRAKCEQLARELDVAGIVTFLGHVDPKALLPRGEAFLHTAEREGFCRSLLEASYVGLPCIGYEVKGVVDVPGVVTVGLPGDTAALSSALLNIFRGTASGVQVRSENSVDVSSASAWREVNTFLQHVLAGHRA